MLAFNLHEARVAPPERDSEVDSIKTFALRVMP